MPAMASPLSRRTSLAGAAALVSLGRGSDHDGSSPPLLISLSTAKPGEQSQNVYENKGSPSKPTTPGPSLSKEGKLGLPSSDEGGGLCGWARSWVYHHRKTAEQSQNVYENKGPASKPTTPGPSLSKEGNPGLPSSGEGGWDFATGREVGFITTKKRRNKARMFMKTKDRLRNPPPLAPPYPRRRSGQGQNVVNSRRVRS